MGDDTWMTVFPDSFVPNMTFPYDSFNVEDLHTVDEGVIRHLFPLLHESSPSWDFMIGHFLGVDHVGHRLGPDHPTMRTKLTQMDNVLRRVVDALDDETLLVLLGDHGMDVSGDHGGDGELETSAALWIYSKTRPLVDKSAVVPSHLLHTRTFPGTQIPHRGVQQIDLVPSLALTLGLPIPFNNLGMVIPELFLRGNSGSDLTRALELNAQQVRRYLDTYRASASGGELDEAWDQLQQAWAAIEDRASTKDSQYHLEAMGTYIRQALESCRALWAQFNISLIGLGLVLQMTGLIATWVLYSKFGQTKDNWEAWADETRWFCIRGLGAGAILGFAIYFPIHHFVKGVELLDSILFVAPLISCIAVILRGSLPSPATLRITQLPIPLILHALAFASNSFTFWEDHVLTYLLISSIVPFVLTGITAPTARLRLRILGFSALFAICVRLIGISTVCREEQQPYCHVTFFASSSLPAPPLPVLLLAFPVSFGLPWAMRRFLGISKSDKGVSGLILIWVLPIVLLLGSTFWVLEWAESSELLGPEWAFTLRLARTVVARSAISVIIFVGFTLWWLIPLCLEVVTKTEPSDGGKPKTEVTVIGFANAFGSPYLIFWSIFLGLLYTTTQLTGQIILALAAIAVLAYLEVIDSVRDVAGLEAAFASATPSSVLDTNTLRPAGALTFAQITPLALLVLQIFYGTGHQSTISSIQWKTAFMLTATLKYPFSPILVAINTFGPQFLLALAAPLLALWNLPPLPQPAATSDAWLGTLRASLGIMLYHATLLLSSAVCSAWLRRHLMVWKVFAPRFMNAAASLIVVDLAIMVGASVGVARISGRVTKLFAKVGSGPSQ